ncbi:MAG TPA: hypothetical protein VMU95_41345 [Trebonia sp.]|nr:hypothetical protein [Trebonia sp.]
MADQFSVRVTPAATLVRNPSNGLENQTVVNAGPSTCFTGQASGVTASTGTPFPPGSEMKLLKNGLPLYAITAANTIANLQLTAGIGPS